MSDKVIVWTLSLAEASDIVNVLGKLPTEMKAYPLWEKVKGQTEAQQTPEALPQDN